MTLRKDNGLWTTHWPPMGYRCRAYCVNARQSEKLGRTFGEEAPEEHTAAYHNPTTGSRR
jgi:hypothetical protein